MFLVFVILLISVNSVTGVSLLGLQLPKALRIAYAERSSQYVRATPALVFSEIDGQFTNISKLKLTPLGKELVAKESRWMPKHEWADGLSSPETLYEWASSRTGVAYMRLKYYEKGWIDNNRWLDILVDHVADPYVDKPTPQHYFTDGLLVYFNPSQDHSGNSKGDYIFLLQYIADRVRLLGWQAPFTSGYWDGPWEGDVPKGFGTGNSSVGMSPDFPQKGAHLIYELRINLDALGTARTSISPGISIGDSFGFAVSVYDFGGKIGRLWPRELAQKGFLQSAHGTSVIPSYSGTCDLSVQAVDEFSDVLWILAAGTIGSAMLTRRRRASHSSRD